MKADIRQVISVRRLARVVNVRLVPGGPIRFILASVIARRCASGERSGTSHPGSGGSNDKVSDQALFRGCRRLVAYKSQYDPEGTPTFDDPTRSRCSGDVWELPKRKDT